MMLMGMMMIIIIGSSIIILFIITTTTTPKSLFITQIYLHNKYMSVAGKLHINPIVA